MHADKSCDIHTNKPSSGGNGLVKDSTIMTKIGCKSENLNSSFHFVELFYVQVVGIIKLCNSLYSHSFYTEELNVLFIVEFR